jgi:carboxyl-terminal processing protease
MASLLHLRNILLRWVVWFVIIPCLLLPLSANSGQKSVDNARRFNRIWEIIRDNFYDRKMHGVNWDALRERYREKAVEATDHGAFQDVVNALLRELKASHTGYFTDEDMEYYMMRSVFSGDLQTHRAPNIGVMGRSTQEGRFQVQAVLNESPAERAGIKTGDILSNVDGKPFKSVGSFRGKAGSTVKLIVERPGSGRLTVSVQPVESNIQREFLEATQRSVRVIPYQGKRIGYIHLWCMSHDQFRQVLEDALTRKLSDTDGLILDLRDGYGGNPFRYTDVLFRPDILWREERRSSPSRIHRTGYAKPLVVLINGGTRSAKEFFAYQIKKTRRGTLVGETTAGAFLGAIGFPIYDNGYLVLPVVNLILDDTRLEGVGVTPDIAVSGQNAYSPGDRQMKMALEILYPKLSRRTPVGIQESEGNTDAILIR